VRALEGACEAAAVGIVRFLHANGRPLHLKTL
jgi:hypothetical protein